MSPSSACLNATSSLRETHILKQAFDTAYESALISKSEIDKQKALELKASLEKMVQALKEQTAPVEMERLFHLQKQYDFQTAVLKKANLVESRMERNASGGDQEILFIKDAEGIEYPIPSFVSILNKIVEKRELLSVKAEQEFKHLLIVPFGMPLVVLVERLVAYLRAYNITKKSAFLINVDPVSMDSKIFARDANNDTTLVYDQIRLNPDNHGGKTKKAILNEQKTHHAWDKGWRTSLLQIDTDEKRIRPLLKNNPSEITGSSHKRIAMEAGMSPENYFIKLIQAQNNPSDPYHGEFGLTPEEWILSFIYHLEETGTILDDLRTQNNDSTYFLGSYNPHSNLILYAYWSESFNSIDIRQDSAVDAGFDLSLRTLVRI